MFFVPIVEGHGEVSSVPALLYRIAANIPGAAPIRVNHPIRVKVGTFRNDQDAFSRIVALAAAKAAQEGGMVLITLDCEDDCPGVLGPELLGRARLVRQGVPIAVALAAREYETWFLTAATSLEGVCGLPAGIQPPPDPMLIRNAKGWLANLMPSSYDPIRHQTELTKALDIGLACGNHSFARLCRIIRDAVTPAA